MVIDSSALIAILLGEPEEAEFIRAITADGVRLLCAASSFETSMVILSRRGEEGLAEYESFRAHAAIQAVGFEARHAPLALDAFRRFGKGRHPAGLNFGDCMSYALAKSTGEPLLFKGDDFSRTDVRRVI